MPNLNSLYITNELRRYVLTPIMSPEVAKYLQSKNIEFAEASDAAKAMLRIASDRTINGKHLLRFSFPTIFSSLRILKTDELIVQVGVLQSSLVAFMNKDLLIVRWTIIMITKSIRGCKLFYLQLHIGWL